MTLGVAGSIRSVSMDFNSGVTQGPFLIGKNEPAAHHGRRRILHFRVYESQDEAFLIHQLREAVPYKEAPRCLLCSRQSLLSPCPQRRSGHGYRTKSNKENHSLYVRNQGKSWGSIWQNGLDNEPSGHLVITPKPRVSSGDRGTRSPHPAMMFYARE